MCEICGGYFCYPSCPSYDGDSAELGKRLFWCSLCDCAIHETDDYSIDGNDVFCAECARRLSKDDE